MRRELAKDRELSFGIPELMDLQPEYWSYLISARRLEKIERGGGKSPRISCASVEGVTADGWCRLQLR